ncbi:hypothetical protein BB559_002899 [Furculomyces boomerangus]|uniref:Pseudouridine synthase n=1 Tax=Furculomyces boomerangus TaxID=61424 RepID=A0A2T9YRA2_9FUNG|nr:hypothetical protein BB559_002899 [Furculomyces boomerangus]
MISKDLNIQPNSSSEIDLKISLSKEEKKREHSIEINNQENSSVENKKPRIFEEKEATIITDLEKIIEILNNDSEVSNHNKNNKNKNTKSENKGNLKTSTLQVQISSKPKGKEQELSESSKVPESEMKVPIYSFENGLRKVIPYWFTFRAHAKQRWFGKSIYNVFSTEFRDKDPEYYKEAIINGKIMVNEKMVDPEYKIKNGDLITHISHRHEPSVHDKKINILGLVSPTKNTSILGLVKPTGFPVHPSGRYHYNTLLEMLHNEYGFTKLFPTNRLDRLVSGVMVMATNKKTAQVLTEQMSENKISKVYVCRVLGDFPYSEKVVCEAPVRTIAHKLGLNYVDFENGRSCLTEFTKLSSGKHTSVLLCKPKTGRTHQIRVHLQYLGYPIVNDPLYCNPSIWGSSLGANGKPFTENDNLFNQSKIGEGKEIIFEKKSGCEHCSYIEDQDYKYENEQGIWLHALSYSGKNWHFESELPEWAEETFQPCLPKSLIDILQARK